MAALLVALSVMAVLASAALPAYSMLAKREREQELMFRGRQYVRAIELYQRRYPNTYPPSIQVLVEQRFLRREYLDPVSGEAFVPIHGGLSRMDRTSQAGRAQIGIGNEGINVSGGVSGVVSPSRERSLAEYQGRSRYDEWVFVHSAQGPPSGQSKTASTWRAMRPPVPPQPSAGTDSAVSLPR